ncbi:hypothetical protein GGI15_002737 [Coemansia interrupta]|uniref:RAD50-interacting protein 1 n=1 Tax=Coemansia interrupta TaxID=1126814 RepID=A0A9W8LJV9_9FUNG|nr:hypothetical protein GGI15_002737 [Coemansia interrupta]
MADIETSSPETTALQQLLDNHFPTLESLNMVDDLLRGEEETHSILEEELRAAQTREAELEKEAAGIAEQIRTESLKLIDIHSEIVGGSADDSVSAWQFRDGTETMELVSKLAAQLKTYERLQQSKNYIDIVIDVEKTVEQAKSSISKDPQGVLAACTHAIDILAEHVAAPDLDRSYADRPSNLCTYITQSVRSMWEEVEMAAGASQSESLTKLGWPGNIDMSSTSTVVEFDSSFSMLLNLDRIMRDAQKTLDRSGIDLCKGRFAPLPLEYMARAVDIRMRYHFESSRNTNRADKPEWWLSQILTTLRNIVPFLEAHVQWLYDATATEHLDIRNQFILLLLPIVRRKLLHDRSEYLGAGMIVSSVVRELSDFEHTLQEVYFFDGPSVLDEFLSDSTVFAAWVEAERTSAMKAYMDTVAEPGAFDPVYSDDVLGADDARPSRVSEKAVLLVEDIAERYSMVPSCMLKLQILSTVQFPIIIALVEDVEAEVDEFSRISLPFIRDSTVISPVASANTTTLQSSFIMQLERLASWYQTVWHVEEAARDWNNSAVYVDMWAAVCRRAQKLGDGVDPRDWRDGCDSWSAEDQMVLDQEQPDLTSVTDNDDWLDGGIWERTIKTLGDLKKRILGLVSTAVNKEVVGQMRPYRKKNNWVVPGVDRVDIDISSEMGSVLPELSVLVVSLSSMLPYGAFVRLIRLLADELDTFLTDRVACAHRFDMRGGLQFVADVGAISRVLFASTARNAISSAPQRSLAKSQECGAILSCATDSTSSPTVGSNTEMSLSLEEWGPAIMDATVDDREALLVLAKLGVSHLTVKQVLQLVRNRSDYAYNSVSDAP